MELNFKAMLKALDLIEEEHRIPKEVVLNALKEAMCKAYKKDRNAGIKKSDKLPEINVECEIDESNGEIIIYQLFNVVNEDDIQDDELEISLEEAKEIKPDAELGDVIRIKCDAGDLSRGAATLARSVIHQQISEAEKTVVYDEYINQLNEMVLGIVESVKDHFALINLGKTVAMMPKQCQIPGERLVEGEKIRVVITEVNKGTTKTVAKGNDKNGKSSKKCSQVVVSRADAMLVKRLFEKEVPEIYQGVVEIKAIARDAGERTKMAVMSHNEEIDPIGACIGQRGARVQEIIEELHGEKIDIFLWSDDITQLVKNALAPAEVEAVLPGEEENSLLVIVKEEQLSLAIGRKGKNARLAVKLCDHKIDIKTREELEASGVDYEALLAKAAEKHAEYEKELERKAEEKRVAALKADEEKRKAAVAELVKNRVDAPEETEDIIPEEMKEVVKEKIATEFAFKDEDHKEEAVKEAEPVVEEVKEEVVEETPIEEVETVEEEKPVEAKPKKKKKVDLEATAQKNDYVSAFEKFADTAKPKQSDKPKRKKKKTDDDDIKVSNKVLEKQLRKDLDKASVKPIYTEEELEEIERQERLEEESQYDIDYDEYEDYYNDEDNK